VGVRPPTGFRCWTTGECDRRDAIRFLIGSGTAQRMSVTETRIRPPLGDLVHRTWRPEPHDPLAAFVETIIDCEGLALHARERLFPSGRVELVVHVDEPYRMLAPHGSALFPTACLTGVLSGPVLMEAPPVRARIVAAQLRPAGARALLARPLSDVSGQTVDLRDLLPRAAIADLIERCHAGRSGLDRIEVVRRWLAKQLHGIGRDAEMVAWAVSEIVRTRGAFSIDALRHETGLSWTRLAAVFRDQVGVTPKRYARIVRFRHALALLDESPDLPLTSIALAAGYYDQAHMTGDFRALAGLTPRELRSSARYPGAASIAERDDERPSDTARRNLQDAVGLG
jgi:AraC-like DNA-binding protein